MSTAFKLTFRNYDFTQLIFFTPFLSLIFIHFILKEDIYIYWLVIYCNWCTYSANAQKNKQIKMVDCNFW
ncbi:MAG: hypothetical protein CSA36_02900 [Draconibacterium sp.]|nr:MAG: hypothetical protein CSA36_02900 [Draconibacterium sp.]